MKPTESSPVAPRRRQSRIGKLLRSRKRLIIWTCVIGFFGIYFLVDPVSSVWMPKCVFKMVTGLDCPGCGSQRMFHALFHLDFAAAWSYNPFLMLMLPVVAAIFVVEANRRRWPRLYRRLCSLPFMTLLLLLTLLWFLLRNTLLP